MDDTFKIFVRRLKDGHYETIKESLSPEFLDIHEADLAFESPVICVGTATVADEMLLLQLAIETEATMRCAICNRDVQVKISITDFYVTKRLSEIKSGVFNYQEVLREGILLELPYSAECNGGDCPERVSLAKYFTKKAEKGDHYGSTT